MTADNKRQIDKINQLAETDPDFMRFFSDYAGAEMIAQLEREGFLAFRANAECATGKEMLPFPQFMKDATSPSESAGANDGHFGDDVYDRLRDLLKNDTELFKLIVHLTSASEDDPASAAEPGLSGTPKARAESMMERLLAAHGGRVQVDAINTEVAGEALRRQQADPEMFAYFLTRGVAPLVYAHATRPMPAAQTAKLLRSIGMDVPEVH